MRKWLKIADSESKDEARAVGESNLVPRMSLETARLTTAEAFQLILKREAEESALEAYANALLTGAITPLGLIRILIESEEFGARQSQSQVPMSPGAARETTAEAFRRILKREPDEGALEAYGRALAAEALTPLDMAIDLIESEEFVVRAEQSSSPMSAEAARSIVAEAFRLIFKRDAEESALEAYSDALMNAGVLTLDMIRSLIESDEFGVRAQYHPVVARHLARTVITIFMDRDPGPDTISAYANSIANGHTLESFLREMITSNEFLSKNGAGCPPSMASPLISHDISELAEQLIVARLVNDGLHISAPPQRTRERPPVSQDRMRAMLHTLAMLSDPGGDPVQTEARALNGGERRVESVAT